MTSVAAAGEQPVKHPLLLLGTVMLTTVITAIDATIANVALPHMQGSLAATQDQIGWVLTSYIVASAVCIPPTGWLAGRIGRARLLRICVTGFLIASMLCGAATSLTQMVVFRLLQGAFAAGMAPLGQSIVMDAFPREKHGQVLAIWGIGAMAGPICGPSLGGYLTEALSWRWVFYLNLPLCLLALLGIWLLVPETKVNREQRFDFFGFGLLSGAIGAFQLMLDRGQSVGWFDSTEIIIEATVAAVCLYLFIVHMLTARTPFLEPALFRDRNLMLALLAVALLNFAMMGQMAMLPSYLQQLMHIPVDRTGLLMMPRGISAIFAMLMVGRLIGRVPNSWLMATGFLIIAWTMYEMAHINLYVSETTIITIGMVQGVGMSLTTVPMTTAAFSTLSPALRTEGASFYSLLRNLGGSIGVSVVFARIAEQTQVHHQYIGEKITEFMSDVTLPRVWDVQTTAGAMTLDAEITRQAASIGYMNCYLLLGVGMLIALPVCLLFRDSRRPLPDDAQVAVADH